MHIAIIPRLTQKRRLLQLLMVTNYILHTKITGKGNVIVLLHGFLASSHYFSTLRKNLETTHTVITIDLLGFGQSPKPTISHSYDAHVAALKATINHLGITKPFTIIGHSMGGLIATRYALTYPNEVASLQLFNPPMYRSTAQAIATLGGTGTHYRLMLESPLRRVVWAGIKALPRRRSIKRFPINFTDTVRASHTARETSYQQVILAAELFSDLTKVKTPVLLVVGEHDRPIYHENLKDFSLPPHVSLQLVNTGHHTPVKALAATERLIRAHLLQ